MARRGIARGTKLDVGPEVVKARGRLGAALRDFDEEKAAQAARELARARRDDELRKARERTAHLEAMVAGGVEP